MRIVTSKTKIVSERLLDDDIIKEFEDQGQDDEPRLQFPTLYVVHKRNPYVRQGAFVRWFEDGYEECVVDSPNGRVEVIGYRGPVFTHSTLAPFILAVRQEGFDGGAARQDRRRAMAQVGG